ncbi:MAG: hypothetical protein ABIR11_07900 [Candidatus Limnocylindrales bacterium]
MNFTVTATRPAIHRIHGAAIRVGSMLAAIGLVASLATASAPTAAATVFNANGSGTEIVFCDAVMHSIEVDTTVTMAFAGAVSYPGQLTAVRIQYYAYVTGKWYSKGWRQGYAFPNYFATETFNALPAGRYLVYVDFGWWNGSAWSYRSEYAPVYQQVGWGRSSTCYL